MGVSGNTERPYVIIGAGGHAAVVADILYKCGCVIKGFLDDAAAIGTEVLDAKVIGKIEDCVHSPECSFLIGIGDNTIRKRIAQTFRLEYGIAIHPSASIGRDVRIGIGTVIMAGCTVNPRTTIGEHCIINTKAGIDHDNCIGGFSHISPGAVLGGTVTVGSETHLGIGSCVKNNTSICDKAVVGAGAVVVSDIDEAGTYVGIPARRLK